MQNGNDQLCLQHRICLLSGISGDNSHPSPVEVIQKLKILQIGKNAAVFVQKPAVAMESDQVRSMESVTESAAIFRREPARSR